MREKLIELVSEVQYLGGLEEKIAIHLAASGVTIPVRCKDCDHGSHVDTPEGRVWCEKMCRYMVVEGYCSYGKRRSNEQT